MLSKVERSEAEKILRLLSDEDIAHLAGTITKGQIQFSTRPDAVNAILTYTENAAELLRRQQIKRVILFKYLYNEGMSIAPNAGMHVMMERILQHWGRISANAYLVDTVGEEVMATGDVVQQRSHSNNYANEGANSYVNNYWHDSSLASTKEDQDMALQFSKSFYPMLNACHPLFPSEQRPRDTFQPNIFFRDSNLLLVMVTSNGQRIETFSDSDSVCRRLMNLTENENMIFNPNLEPTGVRGFSDPHGRRVFIVCGTLNSETELVGIFEQQFGLARDPFSDNNWKITFTRLALSTSRLDVLPILDVTRRIL